MNQNPRSEHTLNERIVLSTGNQARANDSAAQRMLQFESPRDRLHLKQPSCPFFGCRARSGMFTLSKINWLVFG